LKRFTDRINHEDNIKNRKGDDVAWNLKRKS